MTRKRIKRYELLDEVGRGGMAVVYRGLDTALEREVAVKVLHPHLASRAESARRFHREARAVARLRHRNIVEIFDTSSEDDAPGGQQFIVTEFVDGGTLREVVEAHRIELECVGVAIALELCEALRHAHAIGIIHRDIKPDNVMVGRAGNVKLMDFGIAQVLDADRMTASGSLLGSPAHMPPEIIDGKAADFRADVFSLGTVLYFVCTNALPFEGNSPTAVLRNIIESRYEEPARRNPRIGRRLSAIIRRCLATDPADRFQTIAELEEALRAELASVGIDDATALARDYLADPAGFTQAFTPVLVERLLERAGQALDERDVGCATDWINRVLAYDTGNERALALLDKLGSRRRVKLLLMVAALCLVLGGTGWALARLAGERGEGVTADAAAAPVAGETASTELVEPIPEVARPQVPRGAIRTSLAALLHDGFERGFLALEPLRAVLAALRTAPVTGLVDGAVARRPRDPAVVVASVESPRVRSITRHTAPTVRRDGEASGDAATTPAGAASGVQPAVDPTTIQPEPPAEPPRATVVIEVFQSDAFAHLRDDTRQFKADGDKRIHLPLAAGHHEIVVTSRRCDPSYLDVTISDDDARAGRKVPVSGVVMLDWKPGKVIVSAPDERRYAYLVSIKGGETRWVPGDVSNFPVPVEHYDYNGKAVPVTVWAIPEGSRLVSQKPSDLGGFAVKSLDVGPGANLRIRFD